MSWPSLSPRGWSGKVNFEMFESRGKRVDSHRACGFEVSQWRRMGVCHNTKEPSETSKYTITAETGVNSDSCGTITW